MSLTAPTVTGYSPFWQLTGDMAAYSMSAAQARSALSLLIAQRLRGYGTRDVTGALAALIGAAAGGTATNQYKREVAQLGPSATVPGVTSVGDFGGNISIETVDGINRATTAGDVTELKKWFATALLEAGITYPTVSGPNISQSTQVNGVTRF